MNEYIDKFISVITFNFDSVDLNNFYCNIKDIKINDKKPIRLPLMGSITTGRYDCTDNSIDIYNAEPGVIYHELFHMASSRYEDSARYEGFATNDYENYYGYIGHGLNEGYTELLTRRYFNTNEELSLAYDYLIYFANLIEMIIGKDNMQKYYLNANLPGLVLYLSKYFSKDTAELLIDNLDYLHINLDKRFFNKRKVTFAIKNTKEILLAVYINKLTDLYIKKEISKEELINEINNYRNLLVNNKNELVFSETLEMVDMYIDNSLTNINITLEESHKLIKKY